MNTQPDSDAASAPIADRRNLAASMAYLGLAFALGCLVTWGALGPRGATVSTAPPELLLQAPAVGGFLNQSLRLIDEERYAEAIEVCERGLSAHPGDTVLRSNLGVAHLLSNHIGQGESVLAQLVADAPEYQRGKNNLAWARRLRVDVEQEIAQNQQALASATSASAKVTALWSLAASYAHLGRVAERLAAYDAILVLEPGNAATVNNAGVALMDLGQYAAARSRFDQASRLSPGESLYRNNVRWAQRSLEQEEAGRRP